MIERRIVGIRQAVPAIRDRAGIEAKSAVVKVSVQMIRILVQGIAELDRKMEKEVAAHPDFFIFDSLPGAGPAPAPRLLSAFGSQRARYGSAQEVQAYRREDVNSVANITFSTTVFDQRGPPKYTPAYSSFDTFMVSSNRRTAHRAQPGLSR